MAGGLDVLALNSGSSSLKFGLYRVRSSRTETLLSGEAQSIARGTAIFTRRIRTGTRCTSRRVSVSGPREAIIRIGRLLSDTKMPAPAAIGYRIVHGGPKLRQHCLIDDDVLALLEEAIPFAPLHIPAALSVIRFAQEHFPGIPQAACFDNHLSCRIAGCRPRPSDPQGIAGERHPALWISRSFVRGLFCASLQTICLTA